MWGEKRMSTRWRDLLRQQLPAVELTGVDISPGDGGTGAPAADAHADHPIGREVA